MDINYKFDKPLSTEILEAIEANIISGIRSFISGLSSVTLQIAVVTIILDGHLHWPLTLDSHGTLLQYWLGGTSIAWLLIKNMDREYSPIEYRVDLSPSTGILDVLILVKANIVPGIQSIISRLSSITLRIAIVTILLDGCPSLHWPLSLGDHSMLLLYWLVGTSIAEKGIEDYVIGRFPIARFEESPRLQQDLFVNPE